MSEKMKILTLCGSLRADSSNALILKLASEEIKEHEWLKFDIARLPYFDPDNQYSNAIPPEVLEVRALAATVDLIFVFTPEYARGIPGILKNAFEWIFHEGTQKKPVYAVIGSGEGENTKEQLIVILTTMDFVISEKQILLLKGLRSLLDKEGRFKSETQKNNFLNFCRMHGAF